METALIVLAGAGLVFAVMTLNRAKPKVTVERVPGHPDTFELWNDGPGSAVIVRADVVSALFPDGAPVSQARAALPGLWVDERVTGDRGLWAKGAELQPLKRFEVRLPAATALRLVYRAGGVLGSIATGTLEIEGGH